MEQDTNQPSEKEPTVLDLYKSVTKDWRSFFNFIRSIWDARRREELNQALAYEAAQPVAVEQAEEPMRSDMFPFRAVLAFLLALLAQALVEPPLRLGIISVAIYLAAFGVAVWSYLSNEWRLPALPVAWRGQDPLTMRLVPLGFALFTGLIAFVLFGDGMFTWLNVAFWLVSLMLLVYSFWVPAPKIKEERIKNRWVWFVLVSAVVAESCALLEA